MKLYILPSNENWICDRFVTEWFQYNKDYTSSAPQNADVIWLLSEWCWQQLPVELLKNKPVICSLHHYVPEKFNKQEFLYRNQFVDVYHIACQQTYEFIKQYIGDKPYFIEPFWTNQFIWNDAKLNKFRLRTNLSIPVDSYVIFSACRDTEGAGIKNNIFLPKIEKGPQILAEFLRLKNKEINNLFVVLAGWRRQYIMQQLKINNINFKYDELPPQNIINDYYNCTDLVVVPGLWEGSPQQTNEGAITKTPVISTPCGIAPHILSNESISKEFTGQSLMECKPNVEYAYEKIQKHIIPNGFSIFKEQLNKLVESWK